MSAADPLGGAHPGERPAVVADSPHPALSIQQQQQSGTIDFMLGHRMQGTPQNPADARGNQHHRPLPIHTEKIRSSLAQIDDPQCLALIHQGEAHERANVDRAVGEAQKIRVRQRVVDANMNTGGRHLAGDTLAQGESLALPYLGVQ